MQFMRSGHRVRSMYRIAVVTATCRSLSLVQRLGQGGPRGRRLDVVAVKQTVLASKPIAWDAGKGTALASDMQLWLSAGSRSIAISRKGGFRSIPWQVSQLWMKSARPGSMGMFAGSPVTLTMLDMLTD